MLNVYLFAYVFFFFNSEVEENVRVVDKLFGQWERVLEQAPNSDDQRRLETTILDQIKEIMDDLNDLEETVNIAVSNPSRFKFSPQELKSREDFIKSTKMKLTGMEATITSPDTQAKAKANARSVKQYIYNCQLTLKCVAICFFVCLFIVYCFSFC